MDFKGNVKAILRTTFIFLNNVYCIPTFLLWMLTLRPLLYIKPALYWWIEGTIFHWLLLLISNWLWMAGYYIAEVGEDVTECCNDKCLVLVNHQSTGDVFVLMNSLQNKGTTSARVCWIMDYIFKYTNFGMVSQCHGDFFIQQGKEYRDKQLEYLKRHLLDVYLPRDRQWIFLFPEGGFLRKRRLNSQKYARKNSYPVLEHVTLPRIGAMNTILKTLVLPKQIEVSNGYICKQDIPILKWVIDITIGYPKNQPLDIFQVLSGKRPSCTTVLYYRKYPISEIPTNEEQLLRWMYSRFEEKERMLETFYASGEFVVDRAYHRADNCGKLITKPCRVELDVVKIWLLNSLFVLSSYFHCYLISLGWHWLMGCL
ncbi:hypothetical protein LSH36_463g02003 [Paralvinella palmiformis]|uniref:Phospholipid/glycerol acyltransferase domain-containing protein n=1 Tax=Paralvinella palmiformis TaxID=53620 RepID=A0AAD9JAG8_9ANNE|nr:hypothetical protein LSH36_463g02003 [Paralvinella palmiformis]